MFFFSVIFQLNAKQTGFINERHMFGPAVHWQSGKNESQISSLVFHLFLNFFQQQFIGKDFPFVYSSVIFKKVLVSTCSIILNYYNIHVPGHFYGSPGSFKKYHGTTMVHVQLIMVLPWNPFQKHDILLTCYYFFLMLKNISLLKRLLELKVTGGNNE